MGNFADNLNLGKRVLHPWEKGRNGNHHISLEEFSILRTKLVLAYAEDAMRFYVIVD